MSDKAEKACDAVTASLSHLLPTVTKAGSQINSAAAKMTQYISGEPINDALFLDDYYKKENQNLQKNLKNYKTNISRYPDQLRKAEIKSKKFKIFGNPDATRETITNNLDTYKGQLKGKFTQISDKIKSNSLVQHENYNKDLETLILHYKSQEVYAERMQNLLDIKNTEHKKMEDELQKLLKQGLTNNRKAIYEDYEIESLTATRKILFYIYYIIFLLYLIFGNFFTNKEYRKVSVWILMVLYLTVPVYLKYITNGIIYLYRQILYIKDNKLPKNVYTGL